VLRPFYQKGIVPVSTELEKVQRVIQSVAKLHYYLSARQKEIVDQMKVRLAKPAEENAAKATGLVTQSIFNRSHSFAVTDKKPIIEKSKGRRFTK